MADKKDENQKTTGIRIEDSGSVYLGNNEISGFDEGVSVTGTEDFKASGNVIKPKNISDDELETLKRDFRNELKNLESAIDELKGEKDPKVWEKTLDKMSPVAGKVLLGYLKSQGYID